MVYVVERDELTNILINNNGEDIFNYSDTILELVPELIVCNKCEHEHIAHKYNVYTHIIHVVAGVDTDLILKLAALFHDVGKPYVKKKVNGNTHYWGHENVSSMIANLVLNRLSYNEEIINDVCTLIKIHDKKIEPNICDIRLVVDRIGKKNFQRLLALQTSDISAHADEYSKIIIPKLDKLKEVYYESIYK